MNPVLRIRRQFVRTMLRHLGMWRDVPLEETARRQNRFAYSPRVQWLADRSWMDDYREFLRHDSLPAAGADETRILDRRYTLARTAKGVRGLRGSTAECGVFKGVGSGVICTTLDGTYGPAESHFAFDSFEGLPAPKEADRDAKKRLHWKAGDLAVPETLARDLLARFKFCQVVKGWMPQSLQVATDHPFRFVHVDVDLAQSAEDVLEFFYPRMISRGIFVFDDYGFVSCPGIRTAVDRFFADRPEAVIEVTAGQAIVIKV